MTGTSIKILNATIDVDDRGIVVQGIIDPKSLYNLCTDEYQREQLSAVKMASLMVAHRTSRVPTVELGMRGGEEDVVTRDNVFYLQKPTYIVDGYQRITAGKMVQEIEPLVLPRISAVIHLNTDFEWERKRFDKLNIGQTKLSGNVTLRNMRYDNEIVNALFNLSTTNKAFVLTGRVAWEQSKKRSELLTGIMLAKTAGMLHSHVGPGRSNSTIEMAEGLVKIAKNTGKNIFLMNVRTFFEVIEKCWGIKNVAYSKTANQLKLTFLLALARLFSDHTNFWVDTRLVIDEMTVRKLATFPTNDPGVSALVSQAGKASEALALMMAEHVNKNRRTKRLVRRNYGGEYDLSEFGDFDDDTETSN